MKKIPVFPLLVGASAAACVGAFLYPALLTVWGVLISAFLVLGVARRFNRRGFDEPIDLLAADFVFQIFWWGFITHQVAASHGWATLGWVVLGMVGCSIGYFLYYFLARAIYLLGRTICRLWRAR